MGIRDELKTSWGVMDGTRHLSSTFTSVESLNRSCELRIVLKFVPISREKGERH